MAEEFQGNFTPAMIRRQIHAVLEAYDTEVEPDALGALYETVGEAVMRDQRQAQGAARRLHA